mgnify:CR=1 FL=1
MYRLFCNNKTLECRIFFEQFLEHDIKKDVYSSQVFETTFNKIKNWLENNDENLVIDDVDNDILAAVIKKIFRFAAYYILHSTLSVFGDTIETLNMQQKNMFKIIRKTGLYESLPEVFSREDIKVCSEKLFLKSPARSIISKWLNCNRIIALSDGRYQKAYGCQNPTK